MQETPLTSQITQGTRFNEQFPAHVLQYDPELGFVTLPDANLKENQAHVLGYQPLTRSVDVPLTSRSVTLLAAVPSSERTYRRQGEGVGTRLYNTPYSVAALTGYVGRLGVYVTTVDKERMHTPHIPDEETGKGLLHIAHEGLRYAHALKARLLPLEEAVDKVHETYGAAETVRLGDAGAQPAGPVPHHFLLIRSPLLVLYGVGKLVTGAGK